MNHPPVPDGPMTLERCRKYLRDLIEANLAQPWMWADHTYRLAAAFTAEAMEQLGFVSADESKRHTLHTVLASAPELFDDIATSHGSLSSRQSLNQYAVLTVTNHLEGFAIQLLHARRPQPERSRVDEYGELKRMLSDALKRRAKEIHEEAQRHSPPWGWNQIAGNAAREVTVSANLTIEQLQKLYGAAPQWWGQEHYFLEGRTLHARMISALEAILTSEARRMIENEHGGIAQAKEPAEAV